MFTTTDTLPTGISLDTVYFVVNQLAATFQISTTTGGSVLTFSDNGTGIATVLVELPPKSFETVVQGGTDQDVGLSIWESKPAGIQTFGTQTEVVQDSSGIDRTVKFTRPAEVPLEFEVTYEIDPEGDPPSAGDIETAIKAAVEDVTDDLIIGQDVIPSRYYGPIYAAVSGIIVTLIEVKRVSGGAFVSDVLSIENSEFATVTEGNITVIAT